MNSTKIIRAVTVPQSLGFCREIMIKMRGLGYEMIAVSSPGKQLDELREKDGFVTYAVPMARHISIWGDIKSFFRMVSVFRREKPEVVHSMTPKAGLICMMAAWLTRIPVRIHTFTGLVWPTSTGLKRKILMTTDWLTCSCATHIIPEGQGVMNDLKDGGITKKPMRVLGYGNVMGIDLVRFDPARFSDIKKDGDSFTFLFVGRVVRDKGIGELVSAFIKLRGKYRSARLVLVGTLEESLDPLPKDTMEQIKNCVSIDYCGPKGGDELLKEYIKADCFIMPSYREGFPNTVLEAGAMGLPSIVTDINGSREIIIDGENGLIVPPRTVQPLYCAMERIMADNVIREKMQKNARPMIESRFERGFVQNCLVTYYKEILSSYD